VSRWIGGLAEWEEGETTYLSVAFTWLLDEAYTRAELLAEQLGCGVLCAENWPADSVGLQAIPGTAPWLASEALMSVPLDVQALAARLEGPLMSREEIVQLSADAAALLTALRETRAELASMVELVGHIEYPPAGVWSREELWAIEMLTQAKEAAAVLASVQDAP
jgi:hypothetical protein